MRIITVQLIGVAIQFGLLLEQIFFKDNSFVGIIAIMVVVILLNFVKESKEVIK